MQIVKTSFIKAAWNTALLSKTEIIFSFIFATILTMGYILSTYDSVDVISIGTSAIVGSLFGMLVIWGVTLFVFRKLRILLLSDRNPFNKFFLNTLSDKQLWLTISGVIFTAYLPVIVMGNSVLTPDSWSSIDQVLGTSPLSNAHPIIFTGFVGLFIHLGLWLGSFNLGLLFYSLAQSALLAMIFARVIVWMRREHISRNIILATLIFYAVLPVNSFAGMIVWKDILFAGIGLLFLIIVRQLHIEEKDFFTRQNIFGFVTIGFLFCVWRNNGFYAYVVFLLLASILNWRIFFNKKYLSLLISPLVLFVVYSVGTSFISTSTPPTETMSVPLQQIARTVKYHNDSMSVYDKNVINEILPYNNLGKNYNPQLSDPVKSSLNIATFKEHKLKYARLWLKLLFKYPKTYIAAFLYNTYGYIYPFYTSSTTTDIVLDNDIHFNALKGYSDGAYDRGTKQALAEYRNLIESIVPILSNIGFYSCIILLCLYIAIIKRQKELTSVFIILFSIFLTTVLGPVNGEFRYLYLFVVSVPFVISSVFVRDNHKRIRKSHA